VHASLRLDERVEFVHDYEPHMDEILREGSLSHEHLERLGRDHQDVGGLPLVPRAVTPGYVTVPDLQVKSCRNTEGEEPFLLIVDEGLERRDVQASDTGDAFLEDRVDDRDEGSFRLPTRRGGDDEYVPARADRPVGPGLDLPEVGPPQPMGEHVPKGFVQIEKNLGIHPSNQMFSSHPVISCA